MDQRPARLSVFRNSREDIGERHLIVSLDGEKLGNLLFRQVLVRDIAAGQHALRIHNTLVSKTVAFDAQPGDHVRFQAINSFAKGGWSLLLIIGVGPLKVRIERLPDERLA